MHLLIAATAGDCNSLQTPCGEWEVKDEFQGSGISMISAGSVHDSRRHSGQQKQWGRAQKIRSKQRAVAPLGIAMVACKGCWLGSQGHACTERIGLSIEWWGWDICRTSLQEHAMTKQPQRSVDCIKAVGAAVRPYLRMLDSQWSGATGCSATSSPSAA